MPMRPSVDSKRLVPKIALQTKRRQLGRPWK